MRQRPHTDGGGGEASLGQRLGYCLGFLGVQCPHRGDQDLLGLLVVHYADGVGATLIERGDERLVNVHEDHFVARHGEELAQEATADVTGAKDDYMLTHLPPHTPTIDTATLARLRLSTPGHPSVWHGRWAACPSGLAGP